MEPTPKSLTMDLLSAVGGRPMPVRVLVEAADIFGITQNSLRVALARLLARGLIERNERGHYLLATGAEAVRSHVATWTSLEHHMLPWRGGWIGCHTAGLTRADRTALRRWRRALDFLGFRELAPGLRVRPDNLRGGVAAARGRLYALGLERTVPVFAMGALDDGTERRARALWNAAAIRRGYRDMRAALERSALRLKSLPLRSAMVESFVLGGKAIHLLAFDPLLPEPLIPAAERRGLIVAMRRYDRLGRERWRAFMTERGGVEFTSLLEYRAVEPAAA